MSDRSAAVLFAGSPPSRLGAALFLACSWIWVIAMILPTLLVRDYGAWGWVVFAVPNVIGASAVGFLPVARSGRLLVEQRWLCRIFSLVVVALHAFVLVWLIVATEDRLSLIALGALWCAALALARSWRFWCNAAGVLFALSIVLLTLHFLETPATLALGQPRLGLVQLLLFAVASFLGFLVCPFLDASLLSVSEAAPGLRSSFVVGFGLLFLAAIVVAPLYAPELAPLFDGGALPLRPSTPLLLYLVLQATFTLVVHLRCAAALSRRRAGSSFVAPGSALILGAVLGALGTLKLSEQVGVATAGELFYRSFLVLFGISLPVWLLWSRLVPGHRVMRWLRPVTLSVASLLGAIFFVSASVTSGLLALASLVLGVAAQWLPLRSGTTG